MPARDLYHDAVRNALLKDGWTITHDPYRLSFGPRDVFVDLGAERMIGAERGHERIAVEIKTFLGPSEMHDFELALGQYVFYRTLLEETDVERHLYLAVPVAVTRTLFEEAITRPALEKLAIRVIAFDVQREVIVAWKT
jgi:hypothetical protein